PLAALAALLLTLAARGLGRIPAPYLAGQRPLTGLLIGANLGAFVVAFAAGAAGIIALGRAKSGAVVGVLVSITTIPAAANVGVALAIGELVGGGPVPGDPARQPGRAPGRRGGDAARYPGVGAPNREGTGHLPAEDDAAPLTAEIRTARV
ncbi:MAG TPA: DUF389 domain-containing protein, partial [Actinomycetota bacterium]|nr:DUF389 domain-containing protein [Actinomycetota bacterium]